jgi:hypothetical protein
MLAAGRVGPDSYRPYGGGTNTCQGSVLIESKVYTRCGEPIAARMPGMGGLSLCISHAIERYDLGAKAEWFCSVCGAEKRWPSELDGSGRGLECQP